jgi:hypothetical protein
MDHERRINIPLRIINRLRRTSAFFVCLLCWSAVVFPQAKRGSDLTRNDVVILRDKPSVYLCVSKKKKKQDEDSLWLEMHNNTIWTLRFRAERRGTLEKPLRLSNGQNIAGLDNNSVFFPEYQFKRKKPADNQQSGPAWGDVETASWLPSNTSAIFSVPRNYFSGGTLYLEYKYEWEFTGAIADESHGPVHTVYLDILDISDPSGHICD